MPSVHAKSALPHTRTRRGHTRGIPDGDETFPVHSNSTHDGDRTVPVVELVIQTPVMSYAENTDDVSQSLMTPKAGRTVPRVLPCMFSERMAVATASSAVSSIAAV